MNEETQFQKVSHIVIGLAIVFCGFESVPGWGFGLNVPPVVLYCIMGAAGATFGLANGKYGVVGIISGALGGVLALGAVGLLLANVNNVHSIVLVGVAFLGALPAFGLNWLGTAVIDRFAVPQAAEELENEERQMAESSAGRMGA